MQHVETEQQRNAEARLLDRHLLQATRIFRAVNVEERAGLTLQDSFLDVRAGIGTGGGVVAREQVELPDLLLQRHLRDEVVDPLLAVLGLGRNNQSEAGEGRGGQGDQARSEAAASGRQFSGRRVSGRHVSCHGAFGHKRSGKDLAIPAEAPFLNGGASACNAGNYADR